MDDTPTTDRLCPTCQGNLSFDCYVWNPAYHEPCFMCEDCGEDIPATELYYDARI